jgi:hypothetical protein
MFIKIGTEKGEAKDKDHKEDIDVLAWSWGMSNSGSAHTGGGAGPGTRGAVSSPAARLRAADRLPRVERQHGDAPSPRVVWVAVRGVR